MNFISFIKNHIPTRAQYRRWKTLSKLTFMGTVLGSIALLMAIIFFIIDQFTPVALNKEGISKLDSIEEGIRENQMNTAKLLKSIANTCVEAFEQETGIGWEKALKLINIANEEHDSLMAQSKRYYSQQKFRLANIVLSKSLKYDSSSSVFNNRGLTYYHLGEIDSAIIDYSKAIYLNPTSAIAYKNRANAYWKLGSIREAIDDQTRVIEISPNIESYRNRATAYLALSQIDLGFQDYKSAIELELTNTCLYYTRGNSYYILGRYEEAKADFEKAIDLDPNQPNAHHGLGLVFIQYEQYDLAIKCFRRSIELNPNYHASFASLGNIYRKIDKRHQAIKYYSEAISRDSSMYETYISRSTTYFELGKNDLALLDLT